MFTRARPVANRSRRPARRPHIGHPLSIRALVGTTRGPPAPPTSIALAAPIGSYYARRPSTPSCHLAAIASAGLSRRAIASVRERSHQVPPPRRRVAAAQDSPALPTKRKSPAVLGSSAGEFGNCLCGERLAIEVLYAPPAQTARRRLGCSCDSGISLLPPHPSASAGVVTGSWSHAE